MIAPIPAPGPWPVQVGGVALSAPAVHVILRLPGPPTKRTPRSPSWRLPDTANEVRRKHFYAQARAAEEWQTLVVAALCERYPLLVAHVRPSFWEKTGLRDPGPCGEATPAVYGQATALFLRYSTHAPDADGLVRSFKHVQDGLVLAGLVADDRPAVLRTRYWWQRATLAEQRVEVLVWPGFVDVPAEPGATREVG